MAADAENEDNVAEQRRQHGKRVRYGEVIQVMSTWHSGPVWGGYTGYINMSFGSGRGGYTGNVNMALRSGRGGYTFNVNMALRSGIGRLYRQCQHGTQVRYGEVIQVMST